MPCKKVCDPSTSVCNEKTGRCNKIKKSKRSAKSVKSSSKECKKVCPEGSACNRSTGRCKKVRMSSKKTSSKKECKKVCPDGSICNGATGRCNKVKVTKVKAKVSSKKASPKKLSSKKLGSFKECKQVCPHGSECNHATGRCRKTYISKPSKSKQYFSIYSRKAKDKSSPKNTVFHPHYDRDIDVDSEYNCGMYRSSINYHHSSLRDIEENICDILPPSDIKYVLGPVNYSEYKYKNKIISIFGELHGLEDAEEKCLHKKGTVTFANFLSSLVLNNRDKFYDFFVEVQYENKKQNPPKEPIPHWAHALYLIEQTFEKCLRPGAKSTCPYKNLRAHYVDIRRPDIFPYRQVASLPIIKQVEKMFKIIDSNQLMQKELAKSYLKKEILDYIFRELRMFEVKCLKSSEFEREQEHRMPYTGVLLMDTYALARIFRKFKESKTMPSEPTNIIIYAGDAHATNYEDFLETQLGLTPIIKTRRKSKKSKYDQWDDGSTFSPCLNVSSFRGKSLLFN